MALEAVLPLLRQEVPSARLPPPQERRSRNLPFAAYEQKGINDKFKQEGVLFNQSAYFFVQSFICLFIAFQRIYLFAFIC